SPRRRPDEVDQRPDPERVHRLVVVVERGPGEDVAPRLEDAPLDDDAVALDAQLLAQRDLVGEQRAVVVGPQVVDAEDGRRGAGRGARESKRGDDGDEEDAKEGPHAPGDRPGATKLLSPGRGSRTAG